MTKKMYWSGLASLMMSVPVLLSSPVQAQDKVDFSANMALTTDYVFRGVSQTSEKATAQAGIDASYNMFYAGVWASGVDFGPGDNEDFEVDFYAGIKPKFGNFEFDLGAIFYAYPSAKDAGAELDYLELKLGVSTSIDKLSLGGTVYYSPEYTGKTGEAFIYEGTAEYALPMDFALSGTVGTVQFDDDAQTDYTYWNVGVSKTFAKIFTADVRYWDSNLETNANDDSRVVGTLSVNF